MDSANYRFHQGHLNQKATLIRPFQFSIFPYKLCFCDISGGRTFLRSIYRFRTQSIETFSTFYFEVKCLKRQLKHECNKIFKIRKGVCSGLHISSLINLFFLDKYVLSKAGFSVAVIISSQI
jgi:hypothetical protein